MALRSAIAFWRLERAELSPSPWLVVPGEPVSLLLGRWLAVEGLFRPPRPPRLLWAPLRRPVLPLPSLEAPSLFRALPVPGCVLAGCPCDWFFLFAFLECGLEPFPEALEPPVDFAERLPRFEGPPELPCLDSPEAAGGAEELGSDMMYYRYRVAGVKNLNRFSSFRVLWGFSSNVFWAFLRGFSRYRIYLCNRIVQKESWRMNVCW